MPTVTVTTATKLTPDQLKLIKSMLEKKIGSTTIETVIDPTVLGGLKLEIGGEAYDATIHGKLEKIESQLPQTVVTTAIPLSASQRTHILTVLEKKIGMTTLTEVVNPAVIGGIKLTIGSTEYDATIKGKLEQLRAQLMSGV